MANFCLPKELTQPFLKALKSGELDPGKLAEMTSEARRAAFSKIVGEEYAKPTNALFESKLLLKNQQQGIITWAKSVGGLKPSQLSDLAARLGKLEKALSPAEEQKFLEDFVAQKMGAQTTFEQAGKINELVQNTNKAKEAFDKNGTSGYGAARVALENYMNGLRDAAQKTDIANPLTAENKLKAAADDVKMATNFVAENSRAVVASVDNSFWFRQGLRALIDPRFSFTWVKNFAKSWGDIYNTIKGNVFKNPSLRNIGLNEDSSQVGNAIIDAVKAKAYESKNYKLYVGKPGAGAGGTKLDIGTGEESYPTTLPQQIPAFGRFFKASEVAYEAGAMRLRMDLADQVYKWAEKNGSDLSDNEIVGDLNEVVNSMTGRGTFGKRVGSFEAGANKAFFSIKFFKSNLDFLTLHQGRLSTPATKLAATNLLYNLATTYLLLKTAQTLWPKDNKDIFNWTSSNLGKMRFGRMTIDVTHGVGGIIVAAGKIITQKSTSATTGKVSPLGKNLASQTGDEILWDFLGNKLAPIGQVIRETVINHKTYEGTKPTAKGEALKLITPIEVGNVSQFSSESSAMQLLGLIADGLGLNTNVSQPKKK